MNKLEITRDWNIIKEKLKQRWAQLIDRNLAYQTVRIDESLCRVRANSGKNALRF